MEIMEKLRMRSSMVAVVAAMAIASMACNRENSAAAASPDSSALAGAQPGENSGKAGSASEWRDVKVPAGTMLPIVLETSVSSDTSRVEERVDARVSSAVTVHGVTVVPEGSGVRGVV